MARVRSIETDNPSSVSADLGVLLLGEVFDRVADALLVLDPNDEVNAANRAAKKIARRLVLSSAESVWNRRLEVDGLPVFATDWTADARLPHNFGLAPSSLPEALGVLRIDERDLSVQLSGWMLLEAAARVSTYAETQRS